LGWKGLAILFHPLSDYCSFVAALVIFNKEKASIKKQGEKVEKLITLW